METITVDSFIKRVRALEGFDVIVEDDNGPVVGNRQIEVALTKKRSPREWGVSTWIEKRVSKNSFETLAFSVRWGDKKSKPRPKTPLQKIRESYPASFGRDANNASKVKNKLEATISELEVKLTKLEGAVKQRKAELDAKMVVLVAESKRKRAKLAADIRDLEAKSNRLSLQLKDKTKLADMTQEQIDKTARLYGRQEAKEEAVKALNGAFNDLSNPYPGFMDSIRKILEVDDFDTRSLVSTLVARLNDAKREVDEYMNQNRELRMQIAAARS